MPAATNILKAATTGEAGAVAQATPGAEIFAALLSGTEVVTGEGETADEAVTIEATETAEPNLDILAPLLAQQQVVPTVTVPNVAGEGAETSDGASILGGAPVSPLVPSDADGRLNGTQGQNPGPAAVATADAANQAIANAARLLSGRAEGSDLPQPVEVKEPGAGDVKASLTDVAKALGKSDGASNQPAAPTIPASAAAPAKDQQPGGNRQQPEAPVPTIEVQAQQPTTSASDVRSLIASLTNAAGITATGGAAQTGAAQQLGQVLAAQVLNLAGGSEWLDQLTHEIGRATDGSGPLRFRLTPESLGELKVEISHSDRGAVVRMTVGTEAAHAALADAQPKLAAEARAQGVRIAETQVDLAGNQAQQQQQQGRESARQQAASADHTLRAFRAAGSTSTGTSGPAAASRTAERYA